MGDRGNQQQDRGRGGGRGFNPRGPRAGPGPGRAGQGGPSRGYGHGNDSRDDVHHYGRDSDFVHRPRPDAGRYDGGSYGPQNTGGAYGRGQQNYPRSSHQGSAFRGGFQGQGGDRAGIFKDPVPLSGLEESAAKKLDEETKQIENSLTVQTPRASVSHMPPRPGYGQQGTPITVYANHFRITPSVEAIQCSFYRYSVSAHRVIDDPDAGPSNTSQGTATSTKPAPKQDSQVSKYEMRDLLTILMSGPLLSGLQKATDFASYIVTNKPIDFGSDELWTDTLDLSATPGRPRKVRVRVIPTGTFPWTAILEYLRRGGSTTQRVKKEEFLQLLNIIFGYNAIAGRPNVTQVGSRNVFFENSAILGQALGGGLEAFKGFFASARPATNNLLLNLNVVNTAFYKEGPLEIVLASIFSPPLSATMLRKMQRLFLHIRVETNHQRLRDTAGNFVGPTLRKIKTIKGLSIRADQPHLFWNADSKTFPGPGGPISVKQYFRATYGITVETKWPLCNLGTQQREEWVPVELCQVVPGQPYRRLLEPDQTSQIIRYAARPPNANLESIVSQGLEIFGLKDSKSNIVEPWGMTVDRHPMRVSCRILATPALQYSHSSTVKVTDGDWNLRSIKFKQPAQINYLAVIEVTSDQTSTSIRSGRHWADAFADNLRKTGLQIRRCEPHHLCARLPVSDASAGERLYDELKKCMQRLMKAGASYLLFTLPNQDKWFYSRIKFLGDVLLGVPTTCMVASKIWKKGVIDVAYAANVALKVNIKMGGVNHTIQEDPTSVLKDHAKGTMYVGVDVTHPSPGSSDKSPSIAAVVASVDGNLSSWPASLDKQEGRQEQVQALKRMVLERLDLWQRKNGGSLPREIIVYRDGVSEGQYTTLVREEILAIKEAIVARYSQRESIPRLTFLVVGKRHHTRFYPVYGDDKQCVPSFNCKPGTVVDRGITAPDLHDFYLIAHKGLKGTAKPAHYVVALDEIGFAADELQRLTYELCHTFVRATKSISVCPPVYYADLACERARCYLHGILVDPDRNLDTGDNWTGTVHDNLTDTTFYI